MLFKIISRAFSILKLEKNTYKEITQDKSSFIYSSTIIFLAALINVYLFGKYVNPMLPIKIPLMSIFLVWLLKLAVDYCSARALRQKHDRLGRIFPKIFVGRVSVGTCKSF